MENASRALLMSAGILISIILLSVGVYLYNIIAGAKNQEIELLTEEQLVKYNQEFLSYDKGRMYGTDVISLINKAINNNEKYKDDERMYFNVQFKLKEAVSSVTVKYQWDTSKRKYVMVSTGKTATSGYSFVENTPYILYKKNEFFNGNIVQKDFVSIDNFLKTAYDESGKKRDLSETIDGHKSYEITYSGFSDFKRKIFKCTDVKYNDAGRVYYMEFEEVKTSTYN